MCIKTLYEVLCPFLLYICISVWVPILYTCIYLTFSKVLNIDQTLSDNHKVLIYPQPTTMTNLFSEKILIRLWNTCTNSSTLLLFITKNYSTSRFVQKKYKHSQYLVQVFRINIISECIVSGLYSGFESATLIFWRGCASF